MWRRVQVTKVLIMKFASSFCYAAFSLLDQNIVLSTLFWSTLVLIAYPLQWETNWAYSFENFDL
jgi:hypothetical protein